MIVPTLVTLEQAKAHLRLSVTYEGSPPAPVAAGSPLSADDADLQMKLDVAHQIVCDYIADRHPVDLAWVAEIEAWTMTSVGSPSTLVPPVVQMAVLEQCRVLFLRGDGPAEDLIGPPMVVRNLLARYHDPVVA